MENGYVAYRLNDMQKHLVISSSHYIHNSPVILYINVLVIMVCSIKAKGTPWFYMTIVEEKALAATELLDISTLSHIPEAENRLHVEERIPLTSS